MQVKGAEWKFGLTLLKKYRKEKKRREKRKEKKEKKRCVAQQIVTGSTTGWQCQKLQQLFSLIAALTLER